MRKATRFCLALLSGLLAGAGATTALWLNDVDRYAILAWVGEAASAQDWMRSHHLLWDACNVVLLLWPLVPLAAIATLVCAVILRLVPSMPWYLATQYSIDLRRGARWGNVSLSLQVLLVISAFCRLSLELSEVVFLLAEGRVGVLLYRPSDPGIHFDRVAGNLDWLPSLTFNQFTWGPRLPLWIPAVFCLIMALRHFRRVLRRLAFGLCRHCGYDLVGNTSGTCPECGEAIK